jgi:hypothetical protein
MNKSRPEILLDVSKRTVYAMDGEKKIGEIHVPHIELDWGYGVTVPMAGIAGVGTNEAYRKQGIASAMMQKAVEFSRNEGYAVGGVSTNNRNIARRLYSKSGYVFLFKIDILGKKLTAVANADMLPNSDKIRSYRAGDESGIVEVWQECYSLKGFFGARARTPSTWLSLRQNALKENPDCIQVVVENNAIVGYAGFYRHWMNIPHAEIVILPEYAFTWGAGLINKIEQLAYRSGFEYLYFDVSPCQFIIRDILLKTGYVEETGKSYVFQVAIFDIAKLLLQLRPLLEIRAQKAGLEYFPEKLVIETSGSVATAELKNGKPDSYLHMIADLPTLTAVLCGQMSAMEAYLRGLLNIKSNIDVFKPQKSSSVSTEPHEEWIDGKFILITRDYGMSILDAIFPQTGWLHPKYERW